MKIFNKPKNLNGLELMNELAQIGIVVENIVDFGDETIGFNTDNEVEAKRVVSAHNGSIVPVEPTVAEKLASVGLDIDSLKEALGL